MQDDIGDARSPSTRRAASTCRRRPSRSCPARSRCWSASARRRLARRGRRVTTRAAPRAAPRRHDGEPVEAPRCRSRRPRGRRHQRQTSQRQTAPRRRAQGRRAARRPPPEAAAAGKRQRPRRATSGDGPRRADRAAADHGDRRGHAGRCLARGRRRAGARPSLVRGLGRGRRAARRPAAAQRGHRLRRERRAPPTTSARSPGARARARAVHRPRTALGDDELGAAARRRLGRGHLVRPATTRRGSRRAAAPLADRSTSSSPAGTSRSSWSATARPGGRCSARPSRSPASPTPPVLITGESGTGKERVAQLIHELDPRPDKKRAGGAGLHHGRAVAVRAASSSATRGARSPARSAARDGAFELADGGTLFLDEVGELPVALQAELLRVIQEGTFKRVGSNTWRKSTFRLVCATNRDLATEQAGGHVPQRLLLPHRRLHAAPAEPARADRGHPPAVPALLPPGPPGPRAAGAGRRRSATCCVNRAYPGNVRDLRSLVAAHHPPPRRRRARSPSATSPRRSGRAPGTPDRPGRPAGRRVPTAHGSTARAGGMHADSSRRGLRRP